MNTRNEDVRLRAGTYGASNITSTYSIVNFPVQSDQQQDNQVAVPWAAPHQMLPPEYARVSINADGTARADGFLAGVLGPFSYWTFDMVSYVLTNVFPAGVYSALVSMLVYDATNTAWYINATAYRPIPGQDYEPVIGGWKDVKIRYAFGATAGA